MSHVTIVSTLVYTVSNLPHAQTHTRLGLSPTLIPNKHYFIPWLINSTSCDEHFQSFPILSGLAQSPVHHLGDWMNQHRLDHTCTCTCTCTCAVNGDEVNVAFCCWSATIRLTVPSLRNGVTIFAIFCLELATVWRYVCPEDVCKGNLHTSKLN